MPTPKAGKAMNLTTMIPMIIGSCMPDPFRPEENAASVDKFLFILETNA